MNAKYTPRESRSKSDRPGKPAHFPDFPLYAHPLGYWSKKVKGRIVHFGRWGRIRKGEMEHLPYEAGWQEALRLYKERFGDAEAGRIRETVVQPQSSSQAGDYLTLGELCNQFLNEKLERIESGELTRRSFQELKSTTDRLVAAFGRDRRVDDLVSADFQKLRADISKTCGPVRLGNEITRVKSVFKFAVDTELIPKTPNFTKFKKPDKAVLRRERAKGGKKLFTPAEIHALLDAADGPMKAAILLAINAGAGNTDVANLEFRHLDLDAGWLTYQRGKTGIDRRVPLWPETVAAFREAIASRPIPADKKADKNIVLLTPKGERLVRVSEKSRTDGVTTGFGGLLRTLKINGRKGLGFYSLRHTFATIGLQTGDRDAVKALMGHAYGDVLALYDETGPSDERLLAVTSHVRRWLFAGTVK